MKRNHACVKVGGVFNGIDGGRTWFKMGNRQSLSHVTYTTHACFMRCHWWNICLADKKYVFWRFILQVRVLQLAIYVVSYGHLPPISPFLKFYVLIFLFIAVETTQYYRSILLQHWERPNFLHLAEKIVVRNYTIITKFRQQS